MQSRRFLIAVPTALLASQALAENWVTVATSNDGTSYSIDKDSIRRGSDNLVYYTSKDPSAVKEDDAIDCQRRLFYSITLYIGGPISSPDWRDHGLGVKPSSVAEAQLQYVCAKAE